MAVKIKYLITFTWTLLTFQVLSQNLISDSLSICINRTCDTLYIGRSTTADIEQLFGKGKMNTEYIRFRGNTKEKTFKKVERIYYERLKMTFDFATGFAPKSQLKSINPELIGVKAESGCVYYFNDSINLNYSKIRIESLIKPSDSSMTYKDSEVPVYWYFNKGLQIRYSDHSDNAKVEWLYYYESELTQRKNIAIMNKWMEENGIKK